MTFLAWCLAAVLALTLPVRADAPDLAGSADPSMPIVPRADHMPPLPAVRTISILSGQTRHYSVTEHRGWLVLDLTLRVRPADYETLPASGCAGEAAGSECISFRSGGEGMNSQWDNAESAPTGKPILVAGNGPTRFAYRDERGQWRKLHHRPMDNAPKVWMEIPRFKEPATAPEPRQDRRSGVSGHGEPPDTPTGDTR